MNDAQALAYQIMFNALSVLVGTPDTAFELAIVDPQGLAQAQRAIATARKAGTSIMVAAFDGHVPDEARSTVGTITTPDQEGA